MYKCRIHLGSKRIITKNFSRVPVRGDGICVNNEYKEVVSVILLEQPQDDDVVASIKVSKSVDINS